MKAALCGLVLLLPAMSLAETALPALHDVAGVAANDVLNVRAAPDVDSALLGSLSPYATAVEVMGQSPDGKWGQINLGRSRVGWRCAICRRRTGPLGTGCRPPCIALAPNRSGRRGSFPGQSRRLCFQQLRCRMFPMIFWRFGRAKTGIRWSVLILSDNRAPVWPSCGQRRAAMGCPTAFLACRSIFSSALKMTGIGVGGLDVARLHPSLRPLR